MIGLVVAGCTWKFSSDGTPGPAWPVREAFDVPPPPGAVSLDLGPVATSSEHALGAELRLRRGAQTVTVEVVDRRVREGETTLTVYAPAREAEAWLLAVEPVSVRIVE